MYFVERRVDSLRVCTDSNRRVKSETIVLLRKFDLTQIKSDSCVLVRKNSTEILIVAIYVDDGLACSNNSRLLDEIVAYLKQKFQITKMQAQCFVGLQIYRDRGKRILFVHQQNYIETIVKRFGLEESKQQFIPLDVKMKYIKDGAADGDISKRVEVDNMEAIGSFM